MNYDQLKSTRLILEYVTNNDAQFTAYTVTKHVDQQDVEKVPPVYGVVDHLVRDGLLEKSTHAPPRLKMTRKGAEFLSKLKPPK